MREEVLVHEGVVALWVLARYADVFVHVEGYDILERDASRFVGLDKAFVDIDRG